MIIGEFDTSARVLLVAELGNNHEGDFERARALVEAAAENGADAVKVQAFRTELFATAGDGDRFERLKRFELSPEQFHELAALARSRGLLFVATALDLVTAEALAPEVDAFKVASGDIDFFPLLERLAATGKPLILSTGASELEEIERAVRFLRDSWVAHGIEGELAVLHCVSAYPAPPEQANLRAIQLLGERFETATVGYSDHVLGNEAAVAAVALGARLIEKHLTLDKALSEFRDHALSADPPELRALAARIRVLESMLGERAKPIQPAELELRAAIRRSVVAAADLPAGTALKVEHLTWLRPSGGLRPGEEDAVLGRTLVRDLKRGDAVLPEYVD
jgi:N,N'-diacetyllegionaminate synthase